MLLLLRRKHNPSLKHLLLKKVFEKVVKGTKKSKSKTKGVLIKEDPNDVEQQKKKQKALGLLKRFSKIRAQTIKEQLITTQPKKKIINEDEVKVEMDDEATDTEDQTQHVSP